MKFVVRQPNTGQSWSGDIADPAAYAMQLANALGQYVEYTTDNPAKKSSNWIEVYPNKKLPSIGGA
jgi:hypothetical protein